ncbi:MAG: glycosyltransferase family 4 protein, partial [Actinomycetota bacterium]|nr:glycosyltransferase family 4 protein [Actinomycetota bacterium]
LAAVGTQVRDDLLAARIGKPGQYTVVPPGVLIETSLSKTEARQRLGLPLDAPIVLFVGRLTQIKRPDRLLEAFRVARQNVPDAVLALAGEGDLVEHTKSQARDLGDNVRFLGWQSDLGAVYPAADVVVLTSDNEGMPVTLIEAQMLGIPCVTTDVGSAREVVINGETGFVTSKDPSDIARAVSRLLSDESLAIKVSPSAKVHAERNFGARRLVNDYANMYRGLIDERAPKA